MKYPLGIQTFSQIREGGYVYVDKTDMIHKLVSSGKAYFLSRPRRFGKSLLISTFEALFCEERSLFDGLAIADTDYDFAPYPVVKLEFTADKMDHPDRFVNYIETVVADVAARYDIELKDNTCNLKFHELVIKLNELNQQKVVLLIDEYDKPILDNLYSEHLTQMKSTMNGFYAMVKSLDPYLQFVFITGVSKFAKISVFSGMNNLTDISMDEDYAAVCGITEQELQHHFGNAIDALAKKAQMSKVDMLAKIKHWYNGYRFEEDAPSV